MPQHIDRTSCFMLGEININKHAPKFTYTQMYKYTLLQPPERLTTKLVKRNQKELQKQTSLLNKQWIVSKINPK